MKLVAPNWMTVVSVLVILFSPLSCKAAASEPTNAREAAMKGAGEDLRIDELYRAKKAALPPAEQAWQTLLEENLGEAFYLPRHKRDFVNGVSTAWDYVHDDAALPRVLIIGDSISRGYTLPVRQALAGKANVHRAPENCGATANGLKKLDVWLQGGKWDVITWNFGIHDRATPPEVYRANLTALLERLRATGARVVWVRTTPAPPSGINQESYTRVQCERLNQIADQVMTAAGIPEIDLCAVVQNRLGELQMRDNVHFSDEGYRLMGEAVAKGIATALPSAPKDRVSR